MLHRHQEVSFQLQDLRTSTESVGFSCISSSPLKPHSEDPGSVPFSGKFCSSRQGFHAHILYRDQYKPLTFLQRFEALQFFLQTCKEQNTYFQGAKYNSLWRPFWSPMDNFVRRNLTQRVQVLLLKAFKRDLIGCSVDS